MNIIGGKMIELLSIDPLIDNNYLHIHFSLNNKAINFKWKIDDKTSASLLYVLENHSINCKYRLSLQGYWDEDAKSYASYVTKVDANGSERLPFFCSEMYVRNLNYLRSIQTEDELKALLPSKKETVKKPAVHKAEKKEEAKEIKNNKVLPRTLTAILFITIIFSMPILFSGDILSSTYIPSSNHSISTSTLITKPTPFTLPDDAIIDASIELSSPFAVTEILDVKTFSIPEKKVAITFDDGPSIYTKQIVDILEEHQIGATFFFLGANLKKLPDVASYAHEHGYAIGNHSYSHTSFFELSTEAMVKEVQETNKLIEQVTGKPANLFRPPYGKINKNIVNTLDEQAMKVVLWDRDSRDWESRNASKIYQEVEKTDPSGAIYLFHETQATIDALPKIIDYLKSQNVEFVNLY